MKKLILTSLLFGASYYFYSLNSSRNLEEPLELENLKEVKSKRTSLISRDGIKRRRKNQEKVKSDFISVKDISTDQNQEKDERYWNYQDPNGDLYITSVFVSGDDVISHGDIIVATAKEAEKLEPGNSVITIKKPTLWPDGLIPYKNSVKGKLAQNVNRAIVEIERSTGIKFRPHKNESNYVEFTYGENNCYSNLGMIGGRQRITLTDSCDSTAILHEMMHTLGFMHEQNREDRDDYLLILWENIIEGHETQFKIIPHQFINYSNFNFDMNSIMLYEGRSFARSTEEYTMLTSSGDIYEHDPTSLSKEDVRRVKVTYNMTEASENSSD